MKTKEELVQKLLQAQREYDIISPESRLVGIGILKGRIEMLVWLLEEEI